jgi:hypothetical protein
MKHIKSINEWRQQLEIPFDKNGKPAHINVLDGLLDIQTKTKLSSYTSSVKVETLLSDAEDNAFEYFNDGFEDEYMREIFGVDFLEGYNSKDLYTDEFIKDVTETTTDNYGEQVKDIMDFSDILDVFENEYSNDISNILNKKGQEQFEKYERDRLYDHFQDEVSDFTYSLDSIENGTEFGDDLISVWRVISYNKAPWTGENQTPDEYQEIIKRGNVGEYWSWDESAAEPHWGNGGGIDLVLHGLVKPENVNWVQTLYKNAYHLKEEREIEIIPGKEILLYDVTTYSNYSSKNKPQGSLGIEPMIVKA